MLDYHRSLELDPRFTGALVGLANNYNYLGDPTRAEIYARRAMSLDPDDVRGHANLAYSLLWQGRRDEACAVARAARTAATVHHYWLELTRVMLLAAIFDRDAQAVTDLAAELGNESIDDPHRRTLRAMAAAAGGRPDEARRWLARDDDGAITNNRTLEVRARVQLMLDDREAALALLERASALDVIQLFELRSDPLFAELKGEPRFERLFTAQS
jgi:Tfp pilus assembly protein PilF